MLVQRVNRMMPSLPPGAMVTYAVGRASDRLVKAACEQVQCGKWLHGWDTVVDPSTDLGRRQTDYIRSGRTGRTYREMPVADGRLVFRFDAGQRCFAEHETFPRLYVVRGGDWRGNPTRMRHVHQRPADWVEDFAQHQDRLAQVAARG